MYEIVLEHDGCPRGTMNGGPYTYEQCLRLLAKYLPPKQYEFGIVSCDTKRHVSFSFVPVQRRTRLGLNYFKAD